MVLNVCKWVMGSDPFSFEPKAISLLLMTRLSAPSRAEQVHEVQLARQPTLEQPDFSRWHEIRRRQRRYGRSELRSPAPVGNDGDAKSGCHYRFDAVKRVQLDSVSHRKTVCAQPLSDELTAPTTSSLRQPGEANGRSAEFRNPWSWSDWPRFLAHRRRSPRPPFGHSARPRPSAARSNRPHGRG